MDFSPSYLYNTCSCPEGSFSLILSSSSACHDLWLCFCKNKVVSGSKWFFFFFKVSGPNFDLTALQK